MITDDFLRTESSVIMRCAAASWAGSGVRPRASRKQGAAASWPGAACGYQLVGSGMPSL